MYLNSRSFLQMFLSLLLGLVYSLSIDHKDTCIADESAGRQIKTPRKYNSSPHFAYFQRGSGQVVAHPSRPGDDDDDVDQGPIPDDRIDDGVDGRRRFSDGRAKPFGQVSQQPPHRRRRGRPQGPPLSVPAAQVPSSRWRPADGGHDGRRRDVDGETRRESAAVAQPADGGAARPAAARRTGHRRWVSPSGAREATAPSPTDVAFSYDRCYAGGFYQQQQQPMAAGMGWTG